MQYQLINLYKWRNIKADSPHGQTRNKWLFKFGAFARYNGLWFPCKFTRYNTIGEPATLRAIPLATVNASIYPTGEISAYDCEVIYSVFNDGMSLERYIEKTVRRIRRTERMVDAGIRRSLNTQLVYAPKRLLKDVKKSANLDDKSEIFVITTNNKDEIGAVPLPSTIDVVEKLWNSYDWARQELSQLLGISYNPAEGKKERVLQQEILANRDLTLMNREMITSRLITSADKFGEEVIHISSEIDLLDRDLNYGQDESTVKGGEENDDQVSGND